MINVFDQVTRFHVNHDNITHETLLHDKISHETVFHDNIIHETLFHDKVSHHIVPHDMLFHVLKTQKFTQLYHDHIFDISHDICSHDKLFHDKIFHDWYTAVIMFHVAYSHDWEVRYAHDRLTHDELTIFWLFHDCMSHVWISGLIIDATVIQLDHDWVFGLIISVFVVFTWVFHRSAYQVFCGSIGGFEAIDHEEITKSSALPILGQYNIIHWILKKSVHTKTMISLRCHMYGARLCCSGLVRKGLTLIKVLFIDAKITTHRVYLIGHVSVNIDMLTYSFVIDILSHWFAFDTDKCIYSSFTLDSRHL